jgi:hypothetical protein
MSVAIYRWHGVISENDGLLYLTYEPSHFTCFCSLCYLSPHFQVSLFTVSHPYKTAGKTILVAVCRDSIVGFPEWETRRDSELSCTHIMIWLCKVNYLLDTPTGLTFKNCTFCPRYLFCLSEQAATSALYNIPWFVLITKIILFTCGTTWFFE